MGLLNACLVMWRARRAQLNSISVWGVTRRGEVKRRRVCGDLMVAFHHGVLVG